MELELKSREDLERMRRAGQIVAEVLQRLQDEVKPGVTTLDLDRIAEEMTRKRGAVPAFKGYRVGARVFPASLCVSINEEVVHGIPAARALREGDIVGLDFGVVVEGYYGDAAVTVAVGKIAPEAQHLLDATRESLWQGIRTIKVGSRLGDLSHAIQSYAEGAGLSVVREFVGHGIGRRLHEEPQVPNFGEPGRGRLLREGMVLAIEPMVNAGTAEVFVKEDGWTAVTRDGSLSAHFEHSVAITAEGPVVLTQL
ncbi:MAG TPA: type I methionyl aminopeptidase [Candidatus Binatia bacterium]|nr:type I methionyl aminopeptidase [Candidatus Binatia bacterium]